MLLPPLHYIHWNPLYVCFVSLTVCLVTSFPADVMPRPLRGVVTAVGQLRSRAGALTLYQAPASWAHGRKAALQCDGRRKAGPKGTAARKQLQLHSGCLEGEWHPLEGRRRAVCGDVRRRKKASKPDKASEKQCEDRRRKKRKRREDALFTRGTHIDGFYDILYRTAVLLYTLNPVPPP